jgi:hypothetical protein
MHKISDFLLSETEKRAQIGILKIRGSIKTTRKINPNDIMWNVIYLPVRLYRTLCSPPLPPCLLGYDKSQAGIFAFLGFIWTLVA